MRRTTCLFPLAFLAMVWGGFSVAQAQSPLGADRIVLAERDAVLLAPPVVVSDGVVIQADWSRDGKYIFAVRAGFSLPTRPGERQEFGAAAVLWNKETQRSRVVWQTGGTEPPRMRLEWVGHSPVVLGTVDVWKDAGPPVAPGKPAVAPIPPIRQRWLTRLDARTGAFRLVSQVPDDAELRTSSSRPLALLFIPNTGVLRFVRTDGTFTDPVALPEGNPLGYPEWNEDGDAVTIGRLAGGEKAQAVWYSLDPATGRSVPLKERPQPAAPSVAMVQPGGLRLVQKQAAVTEGKTVVRIRPLWLEVTGVPEDAEQPRALLASDAESGKLSPGGDAALYLSGGAAWVCPLRRLPKEAYLAARAAARRQMYLSNGKQLGLGLLMYSQDYDDTLPGAGADIQSLVMPYVKSERLFEGFQYTFPGGKVSDYQEPAKTALGFIPVEGGKIQIFLDGHVVFEPMMGN